METKWRDMLANPLVRMVASRLVVAALAAGAAVLATLGLVPPEVVAALQAAAG